MGSIFTAFMSILILSETNEHKITHKCSTALVINRNTVEPLLSDNAGSSRYCLNNRRIK